MTTSEPSPLSPSSASGRSADSAASVQPVEALDSLVLHATDNGVSWITLNRPDALNAVTWDQRERLIGLLADASADPDVRAVVITATGKGFCAGADLRGGTGSGDRAEAERAGAERAGAEPAGAERTSGDVARMIRRGAQRFIAAVLDCEKPVIAAVNGTAAGLGAHLAFACDLVLAAESARFIEVFARRGLVPDGGGAYLLPRLIGPQRAKELMFFGDAVPAAEAERLGLVNRVVPDDELAKTAREWAERLAAGPTRALALTKQLVNASFETDRAAAFAAEATAQEITMSTADAQEGVAAFVERRSPTYRGR
ncbi:MULTISPECIES: enoyl-CoA hydratase/isomerase family protein [Streptomyces]|uniref:Enoyl-CoA hydratase/isomerase family protein n=1 Tax=Streptomyces siderophoricus TaxID=2802281 RepID=A0ABS1MR00_9ACTN|nr:enoyl-CoA hydratase-related protein [Streptomyces sp. 9-7]MBL1090186.1 enoyl-CoA hydratase/isomerase family protein [Streptomyces sp. 9-7]